MAESQIAVPVTVRRYVARTVRDIPERDMGRIVARNPGPGDGREFQIDPFAELSRRG
jgi:hypothetical protein